MGTIFYLVDTRIRVTWSKKFPGNRVIEIVFLLFKTKNSLFENRICGFANGFFRGFTIKFRAKNAGD